MEAQMNLNDERWIGLEGAYHCPYDVRPALRRLVAGETAAWGELWDELHHQGDIGEASYAAIPQLVSWLIAKPGGDWNTYAFAATIEQARRSGDNPPLPSWLRDDYEAAWSDLEARALSDLQAAQDDDLVSSILAVLALAKRKPELARMAMLTEDERKSILDQVGWG